MKNIFNEIQQERIRQDDKWGQQNHPNGSGCQEFRYLADCYREECSENFEKGNGSWSDILLEEVFEALAESDESKLREELIQSAAVIVAWIECLDRRNA